MTYDNKRVLIVGLGESGRAAIRFFLNRGAKVAATDNRTDIELAENIDLHLGEHPESLFLDQDLIVPSPGVPWNLPQLEAARAAGVEVAGELEIAAPELRGKVIGVTGTNGKTTTTAWIGNVLENVGGLKVCIAGNIGTPVLSIVDDSTDDQWSVLELSSFQLEAMKSFHCDIAVVLNITPDHLDRHGDFESYVAAKRQLLLAQRSPCNTVLNADDATVCALSADASGAVTMFSRRQELANGTFIKDGMIFLDSRAFCGVDRLPLRGDHNLENALAVLTAARDAALEDEDIWPGFASFRGVEHRLEFVRNVRGVDFYNDSKATNVDAAIKAIQSFDQGLWLILGGRDKDSDYRPLSGPLRGRARGVALIGEATEKIASHLEVDCEVRPCRTMKEAVSFAHGFAASGDTILLSPACASFDMYKNYEERGNYFKRIVQELF